MKNTTSDRIELKYYINYIDYINLKSKISNIFYKDENSTIEGQYHVRSPWYLDLNNIRITFDSKIKKDEIKLNELFDNNKNMSPVLKNSKIIMEIKYNGNIPSWVSYEGDLEEG